MVNSKSHLCTLLIDDDKVINYYNQKVINKHSNFGEVISVNSGKNGLTYLLDAIKGEAIKPNLIFLDINMPAMNGWEFIEEFKKLDPVFTEDIKIVLLTTSNNPEDFERSKQIELVSEYINKPLSKEILEDLTTKINIKPKVTKHK